MDGADANGYECISVFADPGASGSVFPSGECSDAPTRERMRSKSGCAYEAPSEHRSVNEGGEGMTVVSPHGHLGMMNFQVAALNEALGSVSELVNSGYELVFQHGWSFIGSASGDRIFVQRKKGMWYLECWEVPPHTPDKPNELV